MVVGEGGGDGRGGGQAGGGGQRENKVSRMGTSTWENTVMRYGAKGLVWDDGNPNVDDIYLLNVGYTCRDGRGTAGIHRHTLYHV